MIERIRVPGRLVSEFDVERLLTWDLIISPIFDSTSSTDTDDMTVDQDVFVDCVEISLALETTNNPTRNEILTVSIAKGTKNVKSSHDATAEAASSPVQAPIARNAVLS